MKVVNLSESCVFLQLNLSRMGDKRGVSSEDIEVDADKDRVKVRKVIFKSGAFDAIKSLDSEIRRYVRAQAFPYESGMHLIPLRMVDPITTRLEAYHLKRLELIEHFVEVFPIIVEQAPAHLRALHNASDYTVDGVANQFSMSWQFMQLIAPNNLEQVSNDVFKQEKFKLQERMQEAYEEARMLLRETCLNLVSHLRLSLESDAHGAAKRLSSSTVTHLQEFLNNFELRNVTNDHELETYISQAKALTNGIDAEALRTMDGLRIRMRSELETIETQITRTLLVQPTRRIKVK